MSPRPIKVNADIKPFGPHCFSGRLPALGLIRVIETSPPETKEPLNRCPFTHRERALNQGLVRARASFSPPPHSCHTPRPLIPFRWRRARVEPAADCRLRKWTGGVSLPRLPARDGNAGEGAGSICRWRRLSEGGGRRGGENPPAQRFQAGSDRARQIASGGCPGEGRRVARQIRGY